MTTLPPKDLARRRATIGLALSAVSGVAGVTLAEYSARASTGDKLAKSAVRYQDVGNRPGKDCDDCTQFVAGATKDAAGTCRIVDGPIRPHGHCIAFTPLPKR